MRRLSQCNQTAVSVAVYFLPLEWVNSSGLISLEGIGVRAVLLLA
jgi:hypothetical protein